MKVAKGIYQLSSSEMLDAMYDEGHEALFLKTFEMAMGGEVKWSEKYRVYVWHQNGVTPKELTEEFKK